MPNLDKNKQVAKFYEDFQSHRKYDYFYGDEKRKNLYIQLIGKSNKILDLSQTLLICVFNLVRL